MLEYLLIWGVIMFKNLKILDEKDKRLRQVSKEVTFPLSKEDKETIKDAMEYLKYSQIDEYAKKYDLRAGWGMSAIQIGVLKRRYI